LSPWVISAQHAEKPRVVLYHTGMFTSTIPPKVGEDHVTRYNL